MVAARGFVVGLPLAGALANPNRAGAGIRRHDGGASENRVDVPLDGATSANRRWLGTSRRDPKKSTVPPRSSTADHWSSAA